MEKTFYNDQYIRDFVAELDSITQKDGNFHIILDRTAFFPGTKGQPCDLGYIENEKVIDVYQEDGQIYHVLEKKPIKLHKLKCSIDWERRKANMDYLIGMHVVSGLIYKLFKFKTVDFNFESRVFKIDIDGLLDESKIREIEVEANLIIGDNQLVKTLIPDRKELKKLGIKSHTSINEEIRVVSIEDLFLETSTGIYPKSTIEMRMIKIVSWEKIKGITRIEFAVGKRAVELFFKKDEFTKIICKYLNANEDEAIGGIKILNDNLKTTIEQNKKLSEELTQYQVKEMIQLGEKIGNITIVRKIYDKEDIKHTSKVATKIVENNSTIVLMAVKSEERVNLIFSAAKDIKIISMDELLKDAITLIDGKGGGSTYHAQGAGKNNNNLEAALDYASNRIKQRL